MCPDLVPKVGKPGRVITFYSFKGGVGRTMALANMAVLLAQRGHSVLAMDWDLEAPGLEPYLSSKNGSEALGSEKAVKETPGIVDWILDKGLSWEDCSNEVSFDQAKISVISAGKKDENYSRRVQSLNWSKLFDSDQLGRRLDDLRNSLRNKFDYVLIDSRTGAADVGDICTVILPDILALVFTSNEQSIDGCIDAALRARTSRQKLPVNRSKLVVLPILSRDERDSEYEQANHWRNRISDEFEPLISDWLPIYSSTQEFFDRFYVPYIPYWSFGERLPVLENPRELKDPKSIGYAYNDFAGILENDFDLSNFFGGIRQQGGLIGHNRPPKTISSVGIEGDLAVNSEISELERLREELEVLLNQIDPQADAKEQALRRKIVDLQDTIGESRPTQLILTSFRQLIAKIYEEFSKIFARLFATASTAVLVLIAAQFFVGSEPIQSFLTKLLEYLSPPLP